MLPSLIQRISAETVNRMLETSIIGTGHSSPTATHPNFQAIGIAKETIEHPIRPNDSTKQGRAYKEHMIAEIIAAGSEMLTPFRQDTNSLHLTEGLNDLGVQVAFKTIVGDNLAHLTSAALIALSRADIVIFSGGLGPTNDDLTREAVAAALGIGLYSDNAILAALYKRFAARQMVMPPNNAKQADVLDGATVLENQNGSAPAQYIDTTVLDANGKAIRKIVILLPGPPKELKPLFDNQVKPRLAASLPVRHLAKRMLRMALIPESHVDARSALKIGRASCRERV